MPVFQYTARTLKGDLVNDKIDLPSRDDVIAHLRKNRMVVVQVRAAPREFKLNFKFGGGVKTRDIVVMTRQFATMINAGLPLEIGRAHVLTPVTWPSRMPSSA